MDVQELSEELLVNVFRWLDLPSLCRVAAVCRSFWRVSADDCLWRPFYTAAPLHPWWQPYQAASASCTPKRRPEDRAAATISLREQYAIHARASKLLLDKHVEGRVELRAMIVGDKEVGKHALAHKLHARFKGVSRHICHQGWMHSDEGDGSGNRWWDNKADDDWTVVGPCLEFSHALVHVTTEVATLTPTNSPNIKECGAVDDLQEVQIVRMAECLEVRPDVVVLVFAVTCASSILAVSRQIMPAIRREYNHLPILLVGTHIDHRTPTIGFFTHNQAVALSHRIGASNYVEVSLYEVVGLGATLKEIIKLAIRSGLQQVLQPEKDLVAEALRFRSPRVPNMLDTIPSIHYRLRCVRCSAMPIVGQAWTCKSCGHTEQAPMCSSCKRHHLQRKVEHRVVLYSAERNNKRVTQKTSGQLRAAMHEGEGEDGSARDRVAGEQPDLQLQLAQVGFSHRNSRFFHQHHRGHHHKRQRVDHRHPAIEREKDEIFQLFSKRN